MNYRKLRIAWSVTWGVVAVLLCVLWVRSKEWVDQMYIPVGQSCTICQSMPNAILVTWMSNQPAEFIRVSIPAAPSAAYIASVTGQPPQIPPMFAIQSNGVMMRHWCSVLIVISFAGLPWGSLLPSRFSLRTLLIATTLIAIMLGLIVWAAE